MVDEQDEVFLVAADDGPTPIASISRKNFLGYETAAGGKMLIRFKTPRMPQKDAWEERQVIFSIEPANTHIPRIMERWGIHA
jgi:hypothetical protein